MKNNVKINLDKVGLLITHYKRPESLRKLLEKFEELEVKFAQIVVSDDGSGEPYESQLESMKKDFNFDLVLTPVNAGLGNNINKGQDQLRTPYTIYVQEDFLPTEKFVEGFLKAQTYMEDDISIDMVKFWCWHSYPYLRGYKDSEDYKLANFKVFAIDPYRFFLYGDPPHLRRSNFFEKFGRYTEGIPAPKTEKAMAMSFLQKGGRALWHESRDMFIHENSEDEPSTQNYKGLKQSIKEALPDIIFNVIWSLKLTAEFIFVKFSSLDRSPKVLGK